MADTEEVMTRPQHQSDGTLLRSTSYQPVISADMSKEEQAVLRALPDIWNDLRIRPAGKQRKAAIRTAGNFHGVSPLWLLKQGCAAIRRQRKLRQQQKDAKVLAAE